MTNIQLNVLFKKMQKDDKKEVLMFHILSDELPHADELLKLPGRIAILKVQDQEGVGAEFVSIQRDDKKTVLKFNVKRDSKKVYELYRFAGNNVKLEIKPSQMSIDEFYEKEEEEEEEETSNDQMSMDDVEQQPTKTE
ncbi:hypothetical protein ABH966_003532 [Lysinibacillus sp. RC46]|uniref:hypothetical protein n=1 Tax=Lysinibacillus sp. RC46 TaxID=3156295 RepID=UPI003515BB77